MIEQIENRRFLNRKTLGGFTPVEFDTYIQLSGGKEDVATVRTKIHYYEEGEGPALLLLHGATQSLYTFRNNVSVLAEHCHVLVPDLLGHGYSDCPSIVFSVEEYALSIEAFLNEHNVGRVSIVAVGQSCAYALDFASYNQDRVRKLVFINPGSFAATEFPGARSIAGGLGSSINKFAKIAFMQKCLDKCYFDKTLLTEEIVREYCLPLQDSDVRASIRLAVANYNEQDVLAKLGALTFPILMITSEDDTISNQENIEHYAMAMRDGYSLRLRNCGYFPHVEKSEKVNAAILEFLQ